MITVIKTNRGYERITGNPVIRSLDKTSKAPLQIIIHPSWTDKERAAYGVYMVTPVNPPEGKRVVSSQFVEEEGRVVQKLITEDKPSVETPVRDTRLKAIEDRLTDIEDRLNSQGGNE